MKIRKFKNNNIFLIGPMGAGKSTVGYYLSKKTGMQFFDSDREIEQRYNTNLKSIFKLIGELNFRYIEQSVICNFTKMSGMILATGGGAICSKLTRSLLINNGIIIYLETKICDQIARIGHSVDRPLLINKRFNVNDILIDLSVKRNIIYNRICDTKISTCKKTITELVNEIIYFYSNLMR